MQRHRPRSIVYFCKFCLKYSTVKYSVALNAKEALVRYLEGTPIRKLASQLKTSRSGIARTLAKALRKVPNSNHVSEIVCKHYCGVLLVDGKYLHVKGHERKIPLLWALDYASHDPIIHMLAPSENYQAYLAFFSKLKAMKYTLDVLVCDELEAIVLAARYYYPRLRVQICTNHYKENIRRTLRSRTIPVHEHFVKQIEYLFQKRSISEYSRYARKLLREHGEDIVYRKILLDINRKHELLIRHLVEKGVPATTNLIESYNSHLEARVRALKGFESFASAEIWLNAYVMNRRLTKFTDCGEPFKHLNGQCSLSITAGWDVPRISLLKVPR